MLPHERQRNIANAAIRTNSKERGPQRPSKPRPPQERAPGRLFQDERGPKTPNLMAAREVFRCTRCGNLLSLRSVCWIDARAAASTCKRASSASRSTPAPAGNARSTTGFRRASCRKTNATPARCSRRARPSSVRPARPASGRRLVRFLTPAAARRRPSTICSSKARPRTRRLTPSVSLLASSSRSIRCHNRSMALLSAS